MGLVVEHVTKSFGEKEAKTQVLNDITFTAEKGQLVILNGASGSGKSTLLSIIGGLLGKSSGEITLDDLDYVDLSDKKLTDMRLNQIGFIFQSSHLIPYLNVTDQLVYVGEMAGMRKKDAKERAEKLLKQIGLSHRLKSYPNELSGGEKQRVAIMRAWMNHPKMILADEPTASLDSKRAIEVAKMIKNSVKENNSIGIMITHDERIFEFADKVIKLSDGRIAEQVS
ncbi:MULTISPECIES: ABC transporter ATP-binding protein [Mammaliicoccus]|jgi:hemin transport system ATP-binding protein|uniref:Putative hemin import ATP-binding protein HrtA n=2 Tax=Staphylococcaceae TaxID=90964 RepID=A0AAW5LKU3_MAMSC|nr:MULTISPECIES: ABC transporter ATP-binding protein [Mammaliicoccus]KTT83704.1 hemin ABC transporter ATP-binding protein [Mammaliicoccus sciuri]MBA1395722.1 ATP-binding cassette domain-containing protein [Mammaliicoccus sciuri]MBF0720652.1 ABC transporter ATP-binding protein [Mammaliicoccus sciuri]MBF0772725.1 ABC transporter ATP-binding protein [Mammaliicoccus sciuri]MBG9205755.1 ABC transporter ATP-binding protein [Mammaliicoccus sciuri]